MSRRLHIYADAELGAYGYQEKEWYLPGVRLDAFLAELAAQGLTQRLDFQSAGPATDSDLTLFHTEAHIASIRRQCATNTGSLDNIAERIVKDALRLLETICDEPSVIEVRDITEPSLTPSMTFEVYLRFLEEEGLIHHHVDSEMVMLTAEGVDFLDSEKPRLSGPTLARAHIERAATWVAGAAIDATRRILDGEVKRVFIPIAGFHHAHPEEARLYCLYNDPALALTVALARLKGHIAYVDIDIHHGDGVYEGFAEEPRVYTVDLHEDPRTLFPHTPEVPGVGEFWGRREAKGRGAGAGTKLNIPLAPGTTDDQYLALWEEAEDFLRAAKPEFIVFEAGVDGLETDPLSHQRLSTDVIYEVTRRVVAIADEFAQGRLLVLGGGGYEIEGSSKGWTRVVEGLLAD